MFDVFLRHHHPYYLPKPADFKTSIEKECKCAAACETGGRITVAQSTHAGLVTVMDLKFVFSLTIFLSLTLSFLRGVVQSITGKVPFPSISGRLQRSIIREINRTGPISCLVPFESAKLLCTSKKMSQFIWDFLSLLCKCQTHTTKPMCSLIKLTHSHSQTYTYTLRGTSFLAQEKQSMYGTKHGRNEISVNDTMVWMINLCSAGLLPLSWVWFKHSHSAILACSRVRRVIQYIKVIVI